MSCELLVLLIGVLHVLLHPSEVSTPVLPFAVILLFVCNLHLHEKSTLYWLDSYLRLLQGVYLVSSKHYANKAMNLC